MNKFQFEYFYAKKVLLFVLGLSIFSAPQVVEGNLGTGALSRSYSSCLLNFTRKHPIVTAVGVVGALWGGYLLYRRLTKRVGVHGQARRDGYTPYTGPLSERDGSSGKKLHQSGPKPYSVPLTPEELLESQLMTQMVSFPAADASQKSLKYQFGLGSLPFYRSKSMEHVAPKRPFAALPDGRFVTMFDAASSASKECLALRIFDPKKNTMQNVTTQEHGLLMSLIALDGNKIAGVVRLETLGEPDVDTLHIWDLATGKSLATYRERDTITSLVAVGGQVACGTYRGDIRLINSLTGTCERTLQGHIRSITVLLPAPNGLLVSGSSDTTIRCWNCQTGKCEAVLQGSDKEKHAEKITALELLRTGHLVSGSADGVIMMWPELGKKPLFVEECKDGKNKEAFFASNNYGEIKQFRVLPDGRLLVMSQGNYHQQLRIFNFQAAKVVSAFEDQGKRLKEFDTEVLAVSPDGKIIVGDSRREYRVGASDSLFIEIKIFSSELKQECSLTMKDPRFHEYSKINALEVLPDGRIASMASSFGDSLAHSALLIWSKG